MVIRPRVVRFPLLDHRYVREGPKLEITGNSKPEVAQDWNSAGSVLGCQSSPREADTVTRRLNGDAHYEAPRGTQLAKLTEGARACSHYSQRFDDECKTEKRQENDVQFFKP
jgi:hypothetical protein